MSSIGLARIVVDELVRAGVRDAVLSPGSRNAPLAYALHDADREGRLRLHVRIDERTAAFLALGLAKASARCVPVVCTSGTAVANLHPAVLEAAHSGIPVLALTADRPLELLGSGANQTTDQARLFGSAVRWTAGLADGMAPSAIRSAVDRAVGWALGSLSGDPGPVHLNVALREPLTPPLGASAGDEQHAAAPRADGPWTALPAAPGPQHRGGAGVQLTARTLLVVGDCPAEVGLRAAAFAARHALPVLAEPSSGAWGQTAPHAPLLAAAPWLDAHRPDQVLVVGRPTLSRPIRRLLGRPDVRTVGIANSPRWVDASLALHQVLPDGVLDLPASGSAPDPSWLEAWHCAGAAARTALSAAWADSHDGGAPLCSPSIAREVVASLPQGALLALGSSSAVRDVEQYADPRSDLLMIANRGLAGIDGTVSTAIGAALALPGRPAYALMGDLTFLHDANGLLIGPEEPRPDLTIVVANDDGGGIFATLEQGASEHAEAFERVFGTPHRARLGQLCAALGAQYRLAEDLAGLRAALDDTAALPGVRVIEARAERTSVRALHARLAQAVAAAL